MSLFGTGIPRVRSNCMSGPFQGSRLVLEEEAESVRSDDTSRCHTSHRPLVRTERVHGNVATLYDTAFADLASVPVN